MSEDFNSSAKLNMTYSNRSSKCNFELNMPLDVQVVGSILYMGIFVFGITGNSLVIYVLFKEKKLRNFTNYLLANLSIADLMVLIACVPSGIHDLFGKTQESVYNFLNLYWPTSRA